MPIDVPQEIGRYRLVRRIGTGNMGIVYLARDTERQLDVALKLMRFNTADEEQSRERFAREGRAAAGLHHRNIVRVLDFVPDGEWPYIAMELLSGSSLADAMARGEALSLDRKLDIVIQLCEALQFAHEQGVVHRDVKPANIWLLDDGLVKLLDFGIAKLADGTVTRQGGFLGSAAYMAPEQLTGTVVDGRADIFAAGVVLYELVSGRAPFEADTFTGVMMKVLNDTPLKLQALVPGLSQAVVDAVETALQKDPARRYAEAAEFGADLRLARHSVVPVPPRPLPVPAAETIRPVDRAAGVGGVRPPLEVFRERDGLHSAAAGGEEHTIVDRPLPPSSLTTSARSPLPWIAAIVLLAIGIFGFGIWRSSSKPAGTFTLDVSSTPPGAELELDGKPVGRTPSSLTLTERPGRLRLKLAGFETVDVPVTEAATSAAVTLNYTLRRIWRVSSEPEGASVWLDGRDTGVSTPVDLPRTDPPPRTIELRLPGFVTERQALTGAMLDQGQMRFSLVAVSDQAKIPTDAGPARRSTPVEVSSPYPVSVSGCGQNRPGGTAHRFNVSEPCKLTLRAPEYYLDLTQEISRLGELVEVAVPEAVKVQLRSGRSACLVSVNGIEVGMPSPPIDLTVSRGPHPFRISCEGGRAYDGVFTAPAESWIKLDDLVR